MDARAGFAVGGFIAGAAAVAVACAVTLSNSVALAESPGTALDVDVVRVTPSQSATPALDTPPSAPRVVPSPVPTTEVVPAPDPQDVAAPRATPATPATPAQPGGNGTPAKPAEPAQPASPANPGNASQKRAPADSGQSSPTDELRAWAESKGWSPEKIDAWLQQQQHRLHSSSGPTYELNRTQTPAEKAGDTSGSDVSSSPGGKRDQSPKPPHGG